MAASDAIDSSRNWMRDRGSTRGFGPEEMLVEHEQRDDVATPALDGRAQRRVISDAQILAAIPDESAHETVRATYFETTRSLRSSWRSTYVRQSSTRRSWNCCSWCIQNITMMQLDECGERGVERDAQGPW
jgi:hypothetical protein